jgi:polyhydroxyalkanoate synthesis regulator phasin
MGVSAALLSQVKNGKKRASLELGLKILRESGASLEERKRWVEERHAEGQELGRIYKDERRKTVEFALKKSLGDLFESTPVLMDLFLDISLMKEKGFSWNGIFKTYGEYGLELVQTLVDSGLIDKKGDRYFVVQDELTYTIDTENSFGIMKSVFESLKQKHKREGFRGEFHFDINDISPVGYTKLKELNVEYTRKMVEIVDKHEMPRVKGGLRVVAQNLVAFLKCFAWVMLLGATTFISSMDSSFAQGSGLRGGGSGKVIDASALQISDLKRSFNISGPGLFTSTRTPYDIRVRAFQETLILEYQKAVLSTPHFAIEEEAVSAVVRLNKALEDGKMSGKEFRHLMQNWPTRCGQSHHQVKHQLKRKIQELYQQSGTIKPQGFKVFKSFSPEGEERYSAMAAFYLPCPESKD